MLEDLEFKTIEERQTDLIPHYRTHIHPVILNIIANILAAEYK